MVPMSTHDADATGPGPIAAHHPLRDEDPARVDGFWLDSRLTATPAGTVFTAHETGGDAVMLVLLSEGAAADPAARARFAGEINAMHIDTVVARGGEGQDDGRMAVRFRPAEDVADLAAGSPRAPWAALAFDGSLAAVIESDRVLRAVDLSMSPPLSRPSGPGYRLHWIDRTQHGPTRPWPLPWPGRTDRAGWITMLVSFLLMALLTALAILLAILVFQNQPPVDAPQPIPSPMEASGSGSGSGSPQPASPSGTASASAGESQGNVPGPYDDDPSMADPDGNESGPAEPTVNPRL